MADHWTENEALLSEKTKDTTRAIKTLMEEIEATMFYQQRVDTTKDDALRDIMAHNRDEEIEHACMTLEWLRRNVDGWDEQLRTYLFSEGDILKVEENIMNGSNSSSNHNDSLNIGNL